jgi:endoglucanase Acf2
MRGVQFILKTPEGVSWFMFASEPINLVFDQISRTTITAAAPFTGVIRLAYIPQDGEGDEKNLDSSTGLKRLVYHSDVYPVGGDIDYEFHRSGLASSSSTSLSKSPVNGARSHATLTFKFATRSMLSNSATAKPAKPSNLLMLALPHHAEVIPKSNILDSAAFDLNYDCIKGKMIPVIGSTWNLNEPLYDINFDGPLQLVDDNIKDVILQQVEDDMNQVLPSPAENVYGYGKQVARLAQLAHIADRFEGKSKKDGNTTDAVNGSSVLDKVSMQLSKYLEAYLSSEVSDNLLFDKNIGGICSKNGLLNKNEDFGNGRYNGKALISAEIVRINYIVLVLRYELLLNNTILFLLLY